MNETILQCTDSGVILLASEPWEIDKPATFQWMPSGVQTIYPRYDGKPIELTVNVTANTAKIVQASLADWHKIRPKQSPFGCIEHREQEAAIRLPKDVAAFSWRDAEGDKDAGVYVTALPTGLGARNVNERIHASWSPSFTTDAAYEKAKTVGKVLVFPKGVRGSRENPAEVTGCAFSVGSLTNKPAFRDIQPVKATEAEIEAAFGEEEDVVTATWSDAAREAALKARDKHQGLTEKFEKQSRAHSTSRRAYQQTINAHTENKPYYHKEAVTAHITAANLHDVAGNTDEAAEHRSMVERHLSASSKKPAKAADSTPTATLYASLAPNADELKKVYATMFEPRTATQELYDRLTADENDGNAQTAGAK